MEVALERQLWKLGLFHRQRPWAVARWLGVVADQASLFIILMSPNLQRAEDSQGCLLGGGGAAADAEADLVVALITVSITRGGHVGASGDPVTRDRRDAWSGLNWWRGW